MMLTLLQTPPAAEALNQATGPGSVLAGVSNEAMAAGGAILLGLILWVSGGKLLKPGIVLVGILLGSIFGSALASGLKLPDFHGVPAPYAGLGLGGLLGLGLALMLYRVAIAGVAAVGLGLGAAAAAALCFGVGTGVGATTADTTPKHVSIQMSSHESPAEGTSRLAQVRDAISSMTMSDLDQVRSQLAGHVETRSLPTAELVPPAIRSAGEQISDSAMNAWTALGSEPRVAMMASAVLGTLLGGLMGLLAPRRASTLVTGLAGAALWMAGGVALIARYAPEVEHQDWAAWTMAHPPAWVIIWVMLGLVGSAAQRSGDPKPAKQAKAAPAPAPKPA